MASLILANLPKSRVILVNLTKTLLVDLAFVYKAFPDLGIALVRDSGEMTEAINRTDIRVIAVKADHARMYMVSVRRAPKRSLSQPDGT